MSTPDATSKPTATDTAADNSGQIDPDPATMPPQMLSGVSPSRLASPASAEAARALREGAWWKDSQSVCLTWQAISPFGDFWELLVPRIQHGRGRELAGLIADGGERLALALAATTEAELWTICREEFGQTTHELDNFERRSVEAAHEMSQRAMAELASYYLLATGHVLVNVTARALALDTSLHPALLDLLGSWFPAGSSDPRDWLSLNKDTARQLRRAAKKADTAGAQELAEPVSSLLMTPAWTELDRVRGAHYHRRRPQSAGLDGVPLASGWTFTSQASQFNAGGGGYTDGDGLAQAATTLARRVLDELRAVMPQLLAQIQLVIEAIKK